MTRAEQAAQAAELRARGMLHREIADEMGISRSYAAELVTDPDGSVARARKDRYRGTCRECGNPTSGCNGRDAAPEYCHQCVPATWQRWNRDKIIAAIKRWHELYGEMPSVWDWSPGMARHNDATDLDRIEMRWENGDWPAAGTVRNHFGAWNNAIEAAGFTPRKTGGRARGDRANRWAA